MSQSVQQCLTLTVLTLSTLAAFVHFLCLSH